jgi:hypothetical protein
MLFCQLFLKGQWFLDSASAECVCVAPLNSSNVHHHHHHQPKIKLGHLLTRSGLTCLEVSLKVSPGFFCLLVCSFLVFLVINYGLSVYMLQPISSVFCPKRELCLVILKSLCLFHNLS